MKLFRLLNIYIVIILLFTINIHSKTPKKLPNIIVIMADDLGYGDISFNGATKVKTPNIDKLAKGGINFTNGHASASTCTPTRYSFLTGKYAFRTEGTGIAPPNGPLIIDTSYPTIASMLKDNGYKTAVIGKWHLGLGKKGVGPTWNTSIKPGPLELGFDYSFLLPTTNDRVPQVYVENHKVVNLDQNDPIWVGRTKPYPNHPTGKTHRKTLKMDWSHGHNDTIHNGISRIGFYTGGNEARFRDEDLADKWIEKSNKWINENKENPFFLFFASHDCHVPRIPHERFQGKSSLGLRGDSIVQLDWCVGELFKTVKDLKLLENTLFVFCSDNGPVLNDGYKDYAVEKNGSHQPSGQYEGGKYEVYEGGTRTPFITYWKNKISPGASDELISTIDLFSSFKNLIQKTKKIKDKGDKLDSVNVINVLLGGKDGKGREELITQGNNKNILAYRKGNWKLHKSSKHKHRLHKGTNIRKSEALKTDNKFRLYNLKDDPVEKVDLSNSKTDVFNEMKNRFEEIISNKN